MQTSDRTYTKDEVMGMMEPLISTWFNERFEGLTEPQAKAIPIIHERKSVLVSSPTGSGKTLTAFTSIINELTRYASEGTLEDRIYCIYISPLKALANDVNRNLNTPLEEMREVAQRHGMTEPKIRVAVRSGDTSQYERQKMVRKPPHILITTPESLALVLAAPKFRENLKNVEWLILDEIHDICDSKRGALLSLTLERLREHCDTDFTRIGLSATLAPIEAIAGYLVGVDDGDIRDVTLIESGTKKKLDLQVICPTDDMTAFSSEIVNAMMYDQLYDLIGEHETTLVFTNTRSGAESVVYKLKERGLESVEVHHSSLGKETRLDVEERLKRGEIRCVVSSTSLELGIDIGSVDLVCQIGSPKSVAKGLQRIGRSGHSMGKIAKGRLLVFDPDDLVECAVMCRAAHRGDIDRVFIPEDCLDVLSQTLVGMSLDKRWDVDEAYRLVKGSYCYRNLSKDKFIGVLRYLGSKDEYEGVYSKLWYDIEENQFGRKKGSRMIYFMNLGTIPEEANYRVLTNHGSVVGELSEKFVERLAPRDVFVLGGRSFEFVRSKGMTAYVKEATGRKPTVPSWAGEMLPRSFDLSMDVARFRGEMSRRLEDEFGIISDLVNDFGIDEGSATSIVSYFKEQKAVAGSIPDDKVLAIEEYIDPSGNQKIIFHFPFGRRVNDALSRGFAYRISNMLGCNVSVTMSDDNFMIGTSRKVDISKIPGMLSSKDLETILRKAIRDSEIFKLRFRHTATRSFMILRNYMGRSVSVNRQQVRSAYLLESLGNMENVPVIEETYREVLEDDMDIKNARVVLDMMDAGDMQVNVMQYNGTPSPFAHNVILSGYSDIVLMEDRSALLRELHRKVLYRAMGDNVKEFEFEEDQIIPYYLAKAMRISEKSDIPRLLEHMGPLQAFRERGRNVYTYADVDRKTLDQWCRELIKEGTIGTVFLDDPHIMTTELIPCYAAATRKERELTEIDSKVLDSVDSGNGTMTEIAEACEMTEDSVFRTLRKLESMYLITRSDISNNKWSFSIFDMDIPDRSESIDKVVFRHLECFAPATVQEISYALSIPENDVKVSLEALVNDGDISRGRFLISENDQYMKRIDHMRLRAGKSNVFDHVTVERYRQFKGRRFRNIREYFEFYGSAGSPLDVFNRVDGFDMGEWAGMRESGEILLGRFVRGRVRYVLAEDGDRYAKIRYEPLMPFDEVVLKAITSLGKATSRQIFAVMENEPKDTVKESIARLDRALKIIRAYDEREHGGAENVYQTYEPKETCDDPSEFLAKQAIRAYGPIPAMGLRFIVGSSPEEASMLARSVGAETILVGDGQVPMFIMPDEIQEIEKYSTVPEEPRILSLYDPSLASKWAEISARYGDRWIYPIMRAERMTGALEIWEMAGCVEVRSMDMDSPDMLQSILSSMDGMMRYYNMKGKDIIRIREVLGTDASELSHEIADMLEKNGYHFINGFYAKGNFIPKTFTDDEVISYVFRKQHAFKEHRYQTVMEAMDDRGYIRTDAELLTRVVERTTMKKQMERGDIWKVNLPTGYMGYTSDKFIGLFRAMKVPTIDDDAVIVESMIQDRQPVTRKELVANSPLSEERTVAAMNALFHDTVVCMDHKSRYRIIRKENIKQQDAQRTVVKMLFNEFGMMSAEMLSYFFSMRMGVVRALLAELETEGFLVKGFLKQDDPAVYWMLASDVDAQIQKFRGMLLLNTQDNLHLYFRDIIKREYGTENVIFKGTEMIGAFKGKLTASGAKVEDFKGTDEAYRYIREVATSLGIRIIEEDQEDDDWDVSEFYLKTNPGAI